VRKTTNTSKQSILYGGVSFLAFILTILAIAYPSFDGRINSLYGYIVSGIAVTLIYYYRKKEAPTKDNPILAIAGWIFSLASVIVGVLGYVKSFLKDNL